MPTGPVLVTKIDNTASGRPQIGLERADVVYVEEVEYGLTRLAAVFASRYPRQVGPVRSVRTSDTQMLGAYGRAALVFSGGAGGPLAALRKSALRDASYNRFPGTYRRLGTRHAPYNLVTDLYRLSQAVRNVSRVRYVGFRWSLRDARVARARKVNAVSILVGQTWVRWHWDLPHHVWVQVRENGRIVRTASGAPLSTANLVVQRCRVRIDRGNVDVNGAPSQFTQTVGRGSAMIFRDGRMLAGWWKRASVGAATSYLDGHGAPLSLRPGGAWVLLQRPMGPVAIH